LIESIIDIYHGNAVDFAEVSTGGIVAVIHKATQGATFQDSKYRARRDEAKALGLLWGAYHFSTGELVADQVTNFLRHAKPDEDELIALDWEPSDGPDMTIEQARQFVKMIRSETGRWPCIYGGHLIRESVGHMPDEVLSQCPLWYARYATAPVGIPTAIWPTYTLWQYTDGDVPDPTPTQGTSGADRNRFQGTVEQLREQWPFTHRADDVAWGPGLMHLAGGKA
jgi:lysozyme